MKSILTVIVLMLVSSVVFGQAMTAPYFEVRYLDASSLTWKQDLQIYDTLTITGTEQYTENFRIFNGHVTLEWKAKFTATNADTDTVKIMLYRSVSRGTSSWWEKVDSCLQGGRGDTLAGDKWTPSLASHFSPWWKFGFKKNMGVPKLIGISRSSD